MSSRPPASSGRHHAPRRISASTRGSTTSRAGPPGHRRAELQIGAGVFEDQRPGQDVLHARHALGHVIERPELNGPVNFVAPGQVTNAELTEAVAAAVHRPSILRLPSFAARLAPGAMADELLLGSLRVVPRKLLDSGYIFRYPELKPALRSMLT